MLVDPIFQRRDADLILRSIDGLQFRVHKTILVIASPVFEDMASIGGPEAATDGDELPVLPLSEDGKTLDLLLRLIYPIPAPTINGVDTIAAMLEVGRKYQMSLVMHAMGIELLKYVYSDPLTVYAVACRMELEDEARRAIRQLISPMFTGRKGDEFNYIPDMSQITAGSYYRLMRFMRERGDVDKSSFVFCDPTTIKPALSTDIERTKAQMQSFLSSRVPCDIILRSSDGVEVSAHRTILSLSSPVLHERLSSVVLPLDGSLPCLDLPESGAVILQLLRLCYADFRQSFASFPLDTAHEAIQAASRYEMTNVVQRVRSQWMDALATDPLRAYFVATMYGWDDEARRAAKQLASQSGSSESALQAYKPEMERVPASVYHSLLVYNQKYQRARTGVMSRYDASAAAPTASTAVAAPAPSSARIPSIFSVPTTSPSGSTPSSHSAPRPFSPDSFTFGSPTTSSTTRSDRILFGVPSSARKVEEPTPVAPPQPAPVNIVEESKKLERDLAKALDEVHLDLFGSTTGGTKK